jgi:hypothetical protein
MSDRYDDEYDEEEPPPPPPKKPRKPIDWPLWIMILGTVGFLVIFGAITVMAPKRPFLSIRTIGEMTRAKPPPAATAAPKPAATAPAGAATPAAGTTPAPAAPVPKTK